MRAEIDDAVDVLLGRSPSPITNKTTLELMEVAEAYHGRACEMQIQLMRMEAEGVIPKNSKAYKFRTGELRTFIQLCSKAIDLGSRRLTEESLKFEMSRRADELGLAP